MKFKFSRPMSSAVWLVAACFLVGIAAPVPAQDAMVVEQWADYRFLIGDWMADNPEDQGKGECSFALDLQNKVIIRKNHAEIPASKDHPATVHDDLLIMYWANIYTLKADYYDSEGHIIHYTSTVSLDKDTVSFTSEQSDQAPQYRLSYVKIGDGKVAGTFEFAPPGKPGAFSPYLKWTMHRK
ncbi:MAG: hypothetical protein HY851_06020 [candidate division Zixibacteria bacterium]|nr:hypothetical protein [candidate division Zixibacteria bacterium]